MAQKIVVLGAGVSGMTIADGLADRGHDVVVLEAYGHAGGNHLSWDIGPYSFDIGTIYFPRHTTLTALLPGLIDTLVPARHTVQRITPEGVVRHYPLSLKQEVFGRSPAYAARVFTQILTGKLTRRRPRSVTAFLHYYIGARLTWDSGLLYFMRRFYNMAPDEVGYGLARRRMAWIVDHASIRRQLGQAGRKLWSKVRGRRLAVSDWTAKDWFVRPRAGFAAMYAPAVERLRAKDVRFHFDAGVTAVTRGEDGFEVRSRAGRFAADRVVSTVPLAVAAALAGIDATGFPRSNPLLTLCCRFQGERGFNGEVLYNFHREGAWKRLTMHSDFYGRVDGWEYLAVEVTLTGEGIGERAEDGQAPFAEFRDMVQGLGLFRGELELVGARVTPFAYPVYDAAAEEARAAALAKLNAAGIETVGRQGSFEYIPVASEAIALARAHLSASPAVPV